VRLLEARWKPGKNGFHFNEECRLEIKAEFLKPTARTRVQVALFVIFNCKEEDLDCTRDVFLDTNGKAVANIPLIQSETFRDAYERDPTACIQAAWPKNR
jgi:hypothetical protein